MKKASNTYILSLVDIKILDTVSLLNEKKIYPLPEGVYLILKGSERNEIDDYRHLPTYKTLVSFSQKKISKFIMMLLRYHYLENKYDIPSDKFYLKITDKGIVALIDYHKKHRYSYKQKKVKCRTLFLIEE